MRDVHEFRKSPPILYSIIKIFRAKKTIKYIVLKEWTKRTEIDESYLCKTTKGILMWTRLAWLARFLRSRLSSKSLAKRSMCAYERVGWLCFRDLGFPKRNLCKWLKISPYQHFIPVIGRKIIQCIFRDRTEIAELLLLFSLIMKLGIVLFDSYRKKKV